MEEKPSSLLTVGMLNSALLASIVSSEGSDYNVNGPIPHRLTDHSVPLVMRWPPAAPLVRRRTSERTQGELYTVITTTENNIKLFLCWPVSPFHREKTAFL